MVWTTPITFADGDPLTSAQLTTFASENMRETGPGKATRAGRIMTTDSVHNIAERQWARAYRSPTIIVDDQFPITEDPDGNEYGPAVEVAHNGFMLVLYDARIRVTSGAGSAVYAPEIDGRRIVNTDTAARSARELTGRWGCWTWVTADPGVSRITMAYGKVGLDTVASFAQRRLTVIPF